MEVAGLADSSGAVEDVELGASSVGVVGIVLETESAVGLELSAGGVLLGAGVSGVAGGSGSSTTDGMTDGVEVSVVGGGGTTGGGVFSIGASAGAASVEVFCNKLCNCSSFRQVLPTHNCWVVILSANTSFTVAMPFFSNRPNFLKLFFTAKVNLSKITSAKFGMSLPISAALTFKAEAITSAEDE